jgi:hypothetical protein
VDLKTVQKKSKANGGRKRSCGARLSYRTKEERALMVAAKQFGFEQCAFVGVGFESSLTDKPEEMEDDQDPLHLSNGAQVQLPLKSLVAAYRRYLPTAYKDRVEDEEVATLASPMSFSCLTLTDRSFSSFAMLQSSKAS